MFVDVIVERLRVYADIHLGKGCLSPVVVVGSNQNTMMNMVEAVIEEHIGNGKE